MHRNSLFVRANLTNSACFPHIANKNLPLPSCSIFGLFMRPSAYASTALLSSCSATRSYQVPTLLPPRNVHGATHRIVVFGSAAISALAIEAATNVLSLALGACVKRTIGHHVCHCLPLHARKAEDGWILLLQMICWPEMGTKEKGMEVKNPMRKRKKMRPGKNEGKENFWNTRS